MPAQLLALPDDGALGPVGREGDGFLDEVLIARRGLVPVDAARGGQDGNGLASVDTLGESGRGEAAEDDGVDCTKAVYRKNADYGGGDHWHYCGLLSMHIWKRQRAGRCLYVSCCCGCVAEMALSEGVMVGKVKED